MTVIDHVPYRELSYEIVTELNSIPLRCQGLVVTALIFLTRQLNGRDGITIF